MVEVTNLTKKYGSITAVDDISFSIAEGEIVGLLGPNGAGKTTTMNMLTGYISTTSGQIKIDGYDILEQPIEAKKRIGYLPEHPPLYTDMTVKDYLSFVYALKRIKLDRKEHLLGIMDLVGLTDVKDRIIKHLSKGYQQRVGLAQALVGNPKVLILDEPTVGLDPNQIIEIRKLIHDLGKTHTVMISSHILPEISEICEKVIIINKGKLVAMDYTQALLEKSGSSDRMIIRIAGEEEELLKNLCQIEGILAAETVREAEDGIYEFSLQIDPASGVQNTLTIDLAAKGVSVLMIQQEATTLEKVFAELTKEDREVEE